jgi:UrcA family protein
MIQTLLAIALAQAVPTTVTVETSVLVHYGDLDLGSATGRAKLDRRILSAARRACDEPRVPSAAQQKRIAECVASARSGARRNVEQALASANRSDEVAIASSRDPGTM